MNTVDKAAPSPSHIPPEPNNSIAHNWQALAFLMLLLVVAGATATFVGYRAKNADLARKAELRSMYLSAGGTPEDLADPRRDAHALSPSPETSAFMEAYQFNERVRAYGLLRTLEATPAGKASGAILALEQVGATEALNATRDTWSAMTEGKTLPSDEIIGATKSAEANRISKRYDRYIVRDTESHIFRYAQTKLKDGETKGAEQGHL